MRILHVLHHSTPYLDGYGVRSKYIVDFQRRLGLDPVVVTSAHHEIETKRQATDFRALESHDGTAYHRTPTPGGPFAQIRMGAPLLREHALMRAMSASVERVLASHPVDIVHSHSPVLCGRPAREAARRHGLPFVYEIRAFWEDAFLLGTPSLSLAAAKYRFSHAMETKLIRDADAVVAISQHMIDDIASRGVDRGKLHKMLNGVDVGAFAPVERDEVLSERLRLHRGSTLGFIGTFHEIEGIDCLVNAMPAIVAAVPHAKLVLVGTGPEDDNIRRQVEQRGLADRVIQVGRVPHTDVQRYYSVMDVLVYPRHRFRVTELVTPLKPLEAMALGKAVVGSDVGGITELLDDGQAGAIFKAGDAPDLAKQVVRLLTSADERDRLARRGREYALTKRSWESLIPGYLPIYEDVLARARRRA